MIIASRILILRDGSDEIQIPVRIHAPEKASDGAWFCHYEINWPGENHKMDVGGVDSAQALVLALQMIGAEIYSSDYHKSGNLFWERHGDGYGFPVVPTLRDLLRGSDLNYL